MWLLSKTLLEKRMVGQWLHGQWGNLACSWQSAGEHAGRLKDQAALAASTLLKHPFIITWKRVVRSKIQTHVPIQYFMAWVLILFFQVVVCAKLTKTIELWGWDRKPRLCNKTSLIEAWARPMSTSSHIEHSVSLPFATWQITPGIHNRGTELSGDWWVENRKEERFKGGGRTHKHYHALGSCRFLQQVIAVLAPHITCVAGGVTLPSFIIQPPPCTLPRLQMLLCSLASLLYFKFATYPLHVFQGCKNRP